MLTPNMKQQHLVWDAFGVQTHYLVERMGFCEQKWDTRVVQAQQPNTGICELISFQAHMSI